MFVGSENLLLSSDSDAGDNSVDLPLDSPHTSEPTSSDSNVVPAPKASDASPDSVSTSNSDSLSQCVNDGHDLSTLSLSASDVEVILAELFLPEEHAAMHNYFICPTKRCSSLSRAEIERNGKGNKFAHAWISSRTNWWLTYIEGQGMY